MTMMLELSSRMIDYLPEEVSKIQRTIELAVSETRTEEEMFAKVDSILLTNHLREGAREFWDVWSNASDYAEPLTEGVGGFPIDKAILQKNRAKDRNVGRLMDVNGQQVMVINKRSNGDMVVIDKMGKRSVKKAEGLGVTRTEKVELNVLDQIDEEDQSASESPNGQKKKVGKTTVNINPKTTDLMKEAKAKKDWDEDGKIESEKDEVWGSRAKAAAEAGKPFGKKKTNEEVESIEENSYAMRNPEKYEREASKGQSSRERRMNDPKTGINSKAFNDFYAAQMGGKKKKTNEEVEYIEERDEGKPGLMFKKIAKKAAKEYGSEEAGNRVAGAIRKKVLAKEEADPCWKGYQMVGMKDKGGRKVPNCVPKEEYVDLVNQMIEEGYDDEQVRDVLANLEEGYEVIFEEDGYTVQSGEYLDEQFYEEVELVADWLVAEGVIENEDEFFELMEDLSEEEIEELYDVVLEATAMVRKGGMSPDQEAATRNQIASNTQSGAANQTGAAADRAKSLANRPTYGAPGTNPQARQAYARSQMAAHRQATSSNPGLQGYAHQSNDPAVKAKQAARGAQRGSATLTPNEKKNLNMGYEMIGDSLEEGGMEVRTYSWREVMGEAWKKGGKK